MKVIELCVFGTWHFLCNSIYVKQCKAN